MVGYWWALEDCTLSNGCLWAVPGSHSRVVKRRFKRSPTVSLLSTRSRSEPTYPNNQAQGVKQTVEGGGRTKIVVVLASRFFVFGMSEWGCCCNEVLLQCLQDCRDRVRPSVHGAAGRWAPPILSSGCRLVGYCRQRDWCSRRRVVVDMALWTDVTTTLFSTACRTCVSHP